MIKIIKQGIDPKDKKYNTKCSKCRCEFEYQEEDVQHDQRDGDYVECPCCRAFINHQQRKPYGR